MNRDGLVLAVLGAVFLSVGLRWLPDDDPFNTLGLGLPNRQLGVDLDLAGLAEDSGALRARLRAGPGAPNAKVTRWTRLITKAERLVGEHGATPPEAGDWPHVQLRGYPRNDHWMMVYQLFPLRVTGTWYEQGGRKEDAPDDSAVDLFTNRYVEAAGLSASEREILLEAQRRKLERKENRRK